MNSLYQYTEYYDGDVLWCEALRKHEEREIKWYKGNSVMHAFYFLRYIKRHVSEPSQVELWKIKPIALAVLELRLSEDIS